MPLRVDMQIENEQLMCEPHEHELPMHASGRRIPQVSLISHEDAMDGPEKTERLVEAAAAVLNAAPLIA